MVLDKKTSGAWLIHHTHKLQGFNVTTTDYDQINFAGKCGILLNALSASQEFQLNNERVEALAKSNGISVNLELQSILNKLEKQRLIDKTDTGIVVLGLTSSQTLEHTSEIFQESAPQKTELIAISIAEKSSDLPISKKYAIEYVSDTHKITYEETNEVLLQCEQIGFFDSEEVSNDLMYFNGNLFRKDSIGKANAVLSSLNSRDERKIIEFTEILNASGCIAKTKAIELLDHELFSKLSAIGFIDENSIGNESGMQSFVTRPAAFSKFTNSVADDAFDLAKAFVTSLTYGMTFSSQGRGRITMIGALLKKLINGKEVGPATAIGQDYKILEMKGVISVRSTDDGRYFMKLLKREVGQLALAVITEGEASSHSLLHLPNASVTKYIKPELNRTFNRSQQAEPLKRGVAKLLNDLRTGGLR